MKHDRTTEAIQETAAFYALGSLSQHEVRSFESHLREGCSVCEAELIRFEKVVAGIGLCVSEAAPPDYLRDLLEARIERETPPPPARAVLPPAPAIRAQRTPAPVAPRLAIAPANPPNYLPWVFAAGFAILAFLFLLAWKQTERTLTQEQKKTAEAQFDAIQLRAMIELERERTVELEQLSAALGRPGTRIILLSGQDAAPSASATILWDTQKSECVLIGHLPPPSSGKVYQLWLVTADAKISAGLIRTDSVGSSFGKFLVPEDVAIQLAAAEITLEPAGGSSQPTLPVYALGKTGA